MPLKKILIILIILLIVALGILAIYNFFIKENLESNEESNNTTSEYLDSRIKLISQEPVIGPIIDNEKVRYYLASNGNVFESNFDGSNKTQLSSNNLSGLIKVLWSKNKDKVITIFEKNYLLEKYLYDYNTDSSTLLDYKMRWITWSPTQEKNSLSIL